MSHTIEVRSGEPIIWEVWGADFDAAAEGEAVTQKELNYLDASDKPMVLVVDMRLVPLGWDDILYLASNSVPDELNSHPNLRRIIIITTSDVVAKSAAGMNSRPFGYIKLDVAASAEGALAQARHLLA
jgi:hypothetical protein